jgi:hypothetical protein
LKQQKEAGKVNRKEEAKLIRIYKKHIIFIKNLDKKENNLLKIVIIAFIPDQL